MVNDPRDPPGTGDTPPETETPSPTPETTSPDPQPDQGDGAEPSEPSAA